MKSPLIFEAIEFASRAHAGQYRKGTDIPYIIHPLGVMKILIQMQARAEVVTAGVLHDTVEDTPVTWEDIRTRFGAEVEQLVRATSEPDKTLSWEYRKSAMIEHLKVASQDELRIYLADKLDNLQAIGAEIQSLNDDYWLRFNRPRGYQHWYFYQLGLIFTARLHGSPLSTWVAQYLAEVRTVFGDALPLKVVPPDFIH
ncbi:HD domain-containing protein [candidate division KSB1 bacterium]|nr:HD domain-containing protein [candidate division KSB1 bacterium]